VPRGGRQRPVAPRDDDEGECASAGIANATRGADRRAAELKFARVWGESVEFDGQQVSAAHVVADRDVVELHW
jgi:hypothetical protein